MCDCIDRINKHLAKVNTKIELPLWTGNRIIAPFVSTMKVDEKKRGTAAPVFCSHCPFCGISLSGRAREGAT